MGFRDVSVAPVSRRRDGTHGVDRNRSVPKQEGDFSLPADTDKSTWDLDGNVDGNLVIPDDITGLSSLPDVGGSKFISFLIDSQDSQDLKFTIEWYNDENENTLLGTDDENDSDLFGPDTTIRSDVTVVSDFAKIIIESDAADGTQNTFIGSINAH